MNQHPGFLPAYLALGLGCSDVVVTSVLTCLPEDFKARRRHWALVISRWKAAAARLNTGSRGVLVRSSTMSLDPE
jgi:hypothetical protein